MQHDFTKLRETLDKGIEGIEALIHCNDCGGNISIEEARTCEGRCGGCYLDYRIGQRQHRNYEDSIARDPYLGNGTTEDRRRAARGEGIAKSGMF